MKLNHSILVSKKPRSYVKVLEAGQRPQILHFLLHEIQACLKSEAENEKEKVQMCVILRNLFRHWGCFYLNIFAANVLRGRKTHSDDFWIIARGSIGRGFYGY